MEWDAFPKLAPSFFVTIYCREEDSNQETCNHLTKITALHKLEHKLCNRYFFPNYVTKLL